jgi:O-antigen/teichoic acid export membrane protein
MVDALSGGSAASPPSKDPADGLPARFGRNITFNYAAAATNAVVTLVVTPLLLHRLGAAAFGVWSLAVSLTSYLELFEFGFGAATTKTVAEDAWRRPERVVRTLNTSLAVLAALGALAALTAMLLAAGSPAWFSFPADLRTEGAVAVAVMGLALAVSVPGDAFGGALAGHQRYDMLSGSNLVQMLVTGVATVAVVLAGGGIVALAVVTASIGVAMHVVRYRLLRRCVPTLRLTPRLVDRERLRPLMSLSWWFLVSQVMGTVIQRIDLVVVGATLGVREVAVFAIGAKLAQFALRGFRELSAVLMPHAASLVGAGRSDQLPAVLTDGTRISLLAAVPATLVLTVLAPGAIRTWVGRGYPEAAAVLAILVVAVGLRAAVEPTYGVLAASGQVRRLSAAYTAEGLVNLGASLALVGPLGAPGVALGTLIGTVAVPLPFSVIAQRDIGLATGSLWRGSVRPHLLPAAASGALLATARFGGVTGPAGFLAAAVAGLAAYVVVYFAVGATPSDRARARAGLHAVRARLRPRPVEA